MGSLAEAAAGPGSLAWTRERSLGARETPMIHLTPYSSLFDEGAALEPVTRRDPPEPALDVIVIGGGQAGLSVGYHLKRRGLRFLILDAGERVGDAWRKRWDSLRLFTPAWLDS